MMNSQPENQQKLSVFTLIKSPFLLAKLVLKTVFFIFLGVPILLFVIVPMFKG